MKSRPRLVVYASHPIQYQVPWFRALHDSGELDLLVVFGHMPNAKEQGRGFGVAFQWDVDLLDGYRWQVARTRAIPAAGSGFFARAAVAPRAELRQHNADAALVTGWHELPLVQWIVAARSEGVPVVMRGESNLLRPRRAISARWHRFILNRCDAFLCIGTANRQFYEHYGIAKDRLFSAAYFVDNSYFAMAAERAHPNRQTARAAWDIAPGAICFCFVGKLEQKKRLLTLLDALKVAIANSPRPLHLLVVGAGAQLDEAERTVTDAALPVTFAGFMNQGEIARAYDAADCLVLPSDAGETWGLVVNEAMACGKPAVVSDHVGCQQDLVTDGQTGYVFPLDDTQALARALCRAAASDLPAMGGAARTLLASTCTVERATAATLEAVHSVRRERP